MYEFVEPNETFLILITKLTFSVCTIVMKYLRAQCIQQKILKSLAVLSSARFCMPVLVSSKFCFMSLAWFDIASQLNVFI